MAEEHTDSAPQDAFALLGNEVRASILRTLAAPEDEGPWKELGFAELHRRVDPGMDSSQFNYHLQQLVDHYVRSTEDGYQISPAGVKLYRTIVAGTFTREATIEPFEAGFECHFCGAAVEGSYEDDQFQVVCPECGHVYASNIVPPSVVEEGEAMLHRVDQFTRHELQIAAKKVCPTCLNEMDADLVPTEEMYFTSNDEVDVMARLSCDHCGSKRFMTVGTALLTETSLIAFAHDHGVDVNATPIWELEFASTDRHVDVRSRDPWEVALSLTLDGETLELVVDDDLEVIEETRMEAQ